MNIRISTDNGPKFKIALDDTIFEATQVEFNKFYNSVSATLQPSQPFTSAHQGDGGEFQELSVTAAQKIPYKALVENLGIFKNIKERFHDAEFSELEIIAKEDKFLHLPWEDLFSEICPAFRVVEMVKETNIYNYAEESDNILILSTCARDSRNHDLVNLCNDIVSEIGEIKNLIYGSFKKEINNLFLIRNLSLESSINTIPQHFKLLHIICHGDIDGTLFLSDKEQANQIDRVSAKDFVTNLGEKTFYVSFLSFCHSGCGAEGQDSLAYELIAAKKSKYCVAFQRSIDSEKTIKIVKQFYINLMITDFNIKEAFSMLFKHSRDPQFNTIINELKPVLYL